MCPFIIDFTPDQKLIVSGKVLLPPGEDGPTIEQEIEAGGQLGEVYDVFPKEMPWKSA
jgi:hypothetical protein